jgi:thiol-disulfide isomerase/thioredoxin
MALRLTLILIALLAGCAADETGSATPQSSSPARPTALAPTESVVSSPTSTSRASTEASPSAAAADPLLAAELVDVRTGASFTLGELASDRPVLVETMAIWCTNCRAQQHEVVAAHGLADFHSVSIDVDPNERADDLATYAEREGFDWRFVLADAELATALRDRFSPAILNPPSMPKLLVNAGEVEMIGLNEQLSADEIATLVDG